MKYLVVIELTNTGFSAYSPDVPGCVMTGATREETAKNMEEAISFHLEGLKLEGEPLPEPLSTSVYVIPCDGEAFPGNHIICISTGSL
jgi:predicted RNase H-like HicB family nuclease